MQVNSVDNKYKYQDTDTNVNEETNEESSNTESSKFSLSSAMSAVTSGKSQSNENKTLNGQLDGISSAADKAAKDFKKDTKQMSQDVIAFQQLMEQQQSESAATQEEIDNLYAQIEEDTMSLESLYSSAPSASPAKAPSTNSGDDSANEGSSVVTGTNSSENESSDVTSTADELVSNIQSNQSNVFALIAKSTGKSKSSELSKIRSRLKSRQKSAQKAVKTQEKSNETANKILKISQTTSTVGTVITATGWAGKAVAWGMIATGIGAAAGATILTACKTVICPAGELTLGVGKAGECGSYIALGDTKNALIAGGEAVLSLAMFGSDVAKAAKAAEAANASKQLIDSPVVKLPGLLDAPSACMA